MSADPLMLCVCCMGCIGCMHIFVAVVQCPHLLVMFKQKQILSTMKSLLVRQWQSGVHRAGFAAACPCAQIVAFTARPSAKKFEGGWQQEQAQRGRAGGRGRPGAGAE